MSAKHNSKKGGRKGVSAATREGRSCVVSLSLGPLEGLETGSQALDALLRGAESSEGCYGLIRGEFTQFQGDKSAVAVLAVAAHVASTGGSVLYVDWSGGIQPRYALKMGLPAEEERFLLAQPTSLEQGQAMALEAAQRGVDLIIFDDVGSGVPRSLMQTRTSRTGQPLGAGGDFITPSRLRAASRRVWKAFFPRFKHQIRKARTAVLGLGQSQAWGRGLVTASVHLQCVERGCGGLGEFWQARLQHSHTADPGGVAEIYTNGGFRVASPSFEESLEILGI